ncbi:MAG TPA: FAD-binding oxidoreductase [Iamia sp.]|nr:FAD-binding oxidoreductase [Iamia sp.]
MSSPAPTGGSPWFTGIVENITVETARAKTFTLRLPAPLGQRAGQHVVLRLTAPDGYSAARSYSVASAPTAEPTIDLTVERLDEGEVSTFLHDVAEVGDELELRGPIGTRFAWDPHDGPALLVGGGSGVVPLMSMLRRARAADRSDLVRLVVAARTPGDLLYAAELPGPEVTVTYSRAVGPEGRPAGRLTADDLAAAVRPGQHTFICGSSGFCEAAGAHLLALGVAPTTITVERFGPTT